MTVESGERSYHILPLSNFYWLTVRNIKYTCGGVANCFQFDM